jgi:hypothetical protein
MVLQNFEIIDITKENDIIFSSTFEISDKHFRKDSFCDSHPSGSNTTTATTSEHDGWHGTERQLCIIEKSEIAVVNLRNEDNQHYMNLSWEDIHFKDKIAIDAVN